MLMQYPFMMVLLMMITMFPFLSHPLAMGLNLLFSTLFIGMLIGVSGVNFWVSYTLMLILTGGLLVIFVYVALLASNEKFSSSWAFSVFLFITSMLTIILMGNLGLDSGLATSLNLEYWLKALYSTELWRFTIFIVFYLLITLLVVVYNTSKDSFPLRSTK